MIFIYNIFKNQTRLFEIIQNNSLINQLHIYLNKTYSLNVFY
jgi:hypothetical protein